MIDIDQDFENSSVGQITKLGENWYQIGLRPDTWYWFHFRIRGCRGKEITFNLTYLPQPHSNRWGVTETGDPENPVYTCRVPYLSYDGARWQHVAFAQKYVSMPDTVHFRHRFAEDEAFLSYTIPYTYSDLNRYLQSIAGNPLVSVETIGQTVQGRDVPMVTIRGSDRKQDMIMLISREDADEPTSNCALEGMIGRMISGENPDVRRMLETTTFRIVPMTAIDAVVGGSAYGGPHDVMARRWLDDPPLPEIRAVKDVVADCFGSYTVKLMGKLHGGQTYDNPPVWDFRVFDTTLRKLIPNQLPETLDDVWNPYLRDAVPWVRKLTIFESFLQQQYDFWPFFSTHTNGRDPDNLRSQGARFVDLLAEYQER